MPFRLEIIGDNAAHLVDEFRRLNALTTAGSPEPRSVESLLEEVRSMLADQGMTVRVVPKEKGKSERAAEPAKAEEPKAEEPVGEGASEEPADEEKPAKKKRGGQPKVSKEEAGEALSKESASARKARCVAKLQSLFADGKKKEVMAILSEHGDGAKTFAAVPEEKFEAISKALEEIDA